MPDRILSGTGGGIRYIIPITAIDALETQTGTLAKYHFKFMGGTSASALWVAACAAGVPASKTLEIAIDAGPRIFTPTNDVERLARLVATGHQFDNKVLYEVVATVIDPKILINDLDVGILITAADMLGDPVYFTQDRPSRPFWRPATGRTPLIDAAVASACATTYHQAWNVPGFGPLYDGGTVGLADPSYQTLVYALEGYMCYGSIDPADAMAISLGTGFYRPQTTPAEPTDLLSEIKWVTGSLIGSSESQAYEAAQRQWPGILRSWNVALNEDIDEADVGAIQKLVQYGKSQASQMDWKKILGL